MSPALQELFVAEIMPIILATVPRVVRTVGAEDAQELTQDALADACALADSAEQRGCPIIPKSIAYYSVQRLKSGRRSTSSRRADVMHPGCQLDGRSSFMSLDAEVVPDDANDGETVSLHDALAASQDDPATLAARRLDWGAFWPQLTDQQRTALAMTAANHPVSEIARALKVSSPRVVAIKRDAAEKARRHWGPTVLADAAAAPQWQRDLNHRQQRHHAAG